ncbi:unnamed protein product, partial [Amoebophrya sp. A25]
TTSRAKAPGAASENLHKTGTLLDVASDISSTPATSHPRRSFFPLPAVFFPLWIRVLMHRDRAANECPLGYLASLATFLLWRQHGLVEKLKPGTIVQPTAESHDSQIKTPPREAAQQAPPLGGSGTTSSMFRPKDHLWDAAKRVLEGMSGGPSNEGAARMGDRESRSSSGLYTRLHRRREQEKEEGLRRVGAHPGDATGSWMEVIRSGQFSKITLTGEGPLLASSDHLLHSVPVPPYLRSGVQDAALMAAFEDILFEKKIDLITLLGTEWPIFRILCEVSELNKSSNSQEATSRASSALG